jgi:DNA-binding MarR family transcriptional regulator
VPGWETTQTLQDLQELVDVAALTPAAVARRGGMSVSELHSLRHLADGPRTPGDLARLLQVTSAASSGVVDRLVARGHAERRPREDDRRSTEVVITERGWAEVLLLLRPMFASLADLDAGLDDVERAAVHRYLRGAIDAMRAVQA